MSHSSAIAAVTATLSSRLTKVLETLPGLSATVSHTRPGTANAFASKVGVHLFLYMVTPNAALRNNDLPARDAGGKLVQRPTASLDLHYLLSFVGSDTDLEPQTMLGAITVDLHANPTLGVDEIKAATLGKPFAISRLEQQIERVRLVGEAINLEEFSKLWSVFFQTQYLLSVAYKASVVLLEAEVDTPIPARVRSREVWAAPLPPTIRAVTPALALAGGRLRLQGEGFVASATKLRFMQADGLELEAAPVLLLDDRIDVDLPAGLVAGIAAVAVVTTHDASSPDATRSFEFESSAAGFTLAPRIVQGALLEPLVSVSGLLGGSLEFDVVPPLAATQTLVVVIGSLRVTPSATTTTAQCTHVVATIPTSGLAPNTTYPLRVAIDRTTSLVEIDGAEFKPRVVLGGP